MWPLQKVKVAKTAMSVEQISCEMGSKCPQILACFWDPNKVWQICFVLIHAINDYGQVLLRVRQCQLPVCIITLPLLPVDKSNNTCS